MTLATSVKILGDALTGIAELHHRIEGKPLAVCGECRAPWPCHTRTLLEAAGIGRVLARVDERMSGGEVL